MHSGAPLSDPQDARDYVGHEVDYAKRVSALASGGQILLFGTTAALVRDTRIAALSLHAHGERELKGIGRVPLFELLHREKRPQPLEAAAPPQPLSTADAAQLPTAALLDTLARSRIVGRDAELAELRRRVDAALVGTGAVVFLSGEPGIGKTRLATETALYARLQGFQVLSGRCEEEGAAPYQPFAEAMREYLNRTDPERLEATLPPPVACELVRIVPSIVSKVKDVPQVPPLPAEQARQALLEATQQFFGSIAAQEAPLLLFLDDLHWADEGSLALLHHLARQGKNQRLLIVGTYRDVELDTRHPLERTLAGMNRERLYQRLTLRRLPETGVGEMATAILTGASLSAAFVSALYHETEGNPFFIEEVLKHLVEEGAAEGAAARAGGAGAGGGVQRGRRGAPGGTGLPLRPSPQRRGDGEGGRLLPAGGGAGAPSLRQRGSDPAPHRSAGTAGRAAAGRAPPPEAVRGGRQPCRGLRGPLGRRTEARGPLGLPERW